MTKKRLVDIEKWINRKCITKQTSGVTLTGTVHIYMEMDRE